MGPDGAALACRKFFKSAKYIIPMHYGTFPMLTGTFEEF
jgi:L-ascorbate metabolism protein UlaG (beta-lactamase superfamily)